MTRPARNPLDGVDRLLVDGNNLLHALRRGPGAAPPAALVGRLRAAIPAEVSIELVFDGAPEPGLRGTRVAAGMSVRHGGRQSADDLLLSLVGDPGAPPDRVLVVTDDRLLRGSLAARGARTARTAWLLARLERQALAAPAAGNRRPAERQGEEDAERPGWRPGRGATTKHGNPRRRARTGGGPRRAEPG